MGSSCSTDYCCDSCNDEQSRAQKRLAFTNLDDTEWADAIARRDLRKIRRLLDNDISLLDSTINRVGYTAVHYAVINQDDQLLEQLAKTGADINIQETQSNNSPLHIAVVRQNLPAVRILMQHGADTTLRNKRNKTPLDLNPTQKIKNYLKKVTPAHTWFYTKVGVEFDDVYDFWTNIPKQQRKELWHKFIGKSVHSINSNKHLTTLVYAIVYACKRHYDSKCEKPSRTPLRPVVLRLEKILSGGNEDRNGNPIWHCSMRRFVRQLDEYLDVIAKEIRDGVLTMETVFIYRKNRNSISGASGAHLLNPSKNKNKNRHESSKSAYLQTQNSKRPAGGMSISLSYSPTPQGQHTPRSYKKIHGKKRPKHGFAKSWSSPRDSQAKLHTGRARAESNGETVWG